MARNPSTVKTTNIAFIGAGNMASSIIGGLLANGHDAGRISASDPYAPSLEALREMGITRVGSDNITAIQDADVIVLAVKPQILREVATALAPALTHNWPLVISIAAGIELSSLQSWLGAQCPIVRCMPNTPALLGAGATALYANDAVSQTQREQADTILAATGYCCWVDEEPQLDAITALSGSGPAYFFLLIEAMMASAQTMGLSPQVARAMATQTALGAARMACESDVDASELRRRVTSPNGTTEQAVNTFLSHKLPETVHQAMQAAAERAREMAREMG